jgi:hypothetical protein
MEAHRLLTLWGGRQAPKYLRNEFVYSHGFGQDARDVEFVGGDGVRPFPTRNEDRWRATTELADLVALACTQLCMAETPEVGDHDCVIGGTEGFTKRRVGLAGSHVQTLVGQEFDQQGCQCCVVFEQQHTCLPLWETVAHA